MKKILHLGLGLFTVLFFIAGCAGTKPSVVQNINDSHYFQKSVSLHKIERAIRMGASRKGWRTTKIKNGLIRADILVRRKYFVSVNIYYNTFGYKISYKNSRNLKYNPTDNSIHPSYNKWVRILEKNINYEMSNIDMSGVDYTQPTKMVKKHKKQKLYKKGARLNLNGKTIYIKHFIEYAPNSRVASNIKKECTLPKALVNSIVKDSQNQGINIKFKNHIKRNELKLNIQIQEAVSRGNAFVGHNKFVVISGFISKGKTKYYSFDAARLSGGGYFGAYRSSCSVLGRIAKALGKDVSIWLSNPYDGAMLGDTELIRK